MKIICFTKIDGQVKMVLKCDSSLLVNRKPFFIPDWSEDVRVVPCAVVRVSRLGKNIGQKFASRYYDAVAPGFNIFAADFVATGDWTSGFAFDYSLVVGEIEPLATPAELLGKEAASWVIDLDQAVELASSIMTLRQGDMIVIDQNVAARNLVPEEVLTEEQNGKEVVYCKVK